MRIWHNSYFGRIFPLCKTILDVSLFLHWLLQRTNQVSRFSSIYHVIKTKQKKIKTKVQKTGTEFQYLFLHFSNVFQLLFAKHSYGKLYTFLLSQVIQFSYLAGPSFPFWSSEGALLSLTHSVLMEKIVVKHEANNFVFSIQRVCLFFSFCYFDCRKSKEQIGGRRSSLDVKLKTSWREIYSFFSYLTARPRPSKLLALFF